MVRTSKFVTSAETVFPLMDAGVVAGTALASLAALVLVYYTLWLVVTPLFDDDLPVQAFFPPRYYAIVVPVAAGVVLFSTVTAFVGITMLKAKGKKRR